MGSLRFAVVAPLALLAACATSPLGHRQLKLMSEDQLQAMGADAYAEIKRESHVVRDRSVNRYVDCVVTKVTAAVPADQDWQVTVLNDPSPNAFALPGGKIGVNSGMLQVAENADQLAAVIAHEVAHVTADHHNARLSAAFAADAAQQIATGLAGGGEGTRQVMALLGAGVQYGVIMPYSRSQESEADLLGLRYMASAGFDPRESIELWRNMAAAGGVGPPAFLSTHPSHGDRMQTLQGHLPRAMELYQEALRRDGQPRCG